MKSSCGAVMMYRLEEASAELALSRNLVRISFLIYFMIIDIFIVSYTNFIWFTCMDRLLILVLIFDWIFLSFCIRYWKNKSGGSVLCKNAMLEDKHHAAS